MAAHGRALLWRRLCQARHATAHFTFQAQVLVSHSMFQSHLSAGCLATSLPRAPRLAKTLSFCAACWAACRGRWGACSPACLLCTTRGAAVGLGGPIGAGGHLPGLAAASSLLLLHVPAPSNCLLPLPRHAAASAAATSARCSCWTILMRLPPSVPSRRCSTTCLMRCRPAACRHVWYCLAVCLLVGGPLHPSSAPAGMVAAPPAGHRAGLSLGARADGTNPGALCMAASVGAACPARAAQPSRPPRGAGALQAAVVGLTCRQDVVETLEKRVKSRFRCGTFLT